MSAGRQPYGQRAGRKPYGAPQQHNTHHGSGDLYAHQGSGDFTVNHSSHHQHVARPGIAGRIVLVLLGVDVLWFVWGGLAYTGEPGNQGDTVRSVGMLVLFLLTCAFTGAWFRRKL